MLVMFGDNNVLLLAIVEEDIITLRDGRTLEYVNPPHRPQLIRDVIVIYGRDREHVIEQIQEAGAKVAVETIEKYRKGGRTDRPTRPS